MSQAIVTGSVAFLLWWKENKLEKSDLDNAVGKYIIMVRKWLSEISKGKVSKHRNESFTSLGKSVYPMVN